MDVQMKRDLLRVTDLERDEFRDVISKAREFKGLLQRAIPHRYLEGRVGVLIFEKTSTRTRVSLETALSHLGASAVTLTTTEMQLSVGETIEDTARVLSRYVDVIAIRTYSHQALEVFAASASIPVINALSDDFHPLQALADLMTIEEEFNTLDGRTIAYVGDGNNVCHSLLLASAITGINIRVATPDGYGPREDVVTAARDLAYAGTEISVGNDPAEAVRGAEVIYTDTWVSMGKESSKDERTAHFLPYQVNTTLLSLASEDAIFMHCLPAHRGDEVTDEVIDGPRSRVLDQAENRLHTSKAVFKFLLER